MYIDWLGIVGGLKRFLDYVVIGLVFRSFSSFNSLLEILYHTNNDSKEGLDGLEHGKHQETAECN